VAADDLETSEGLAATLERLGSRRVLVVTGEGRRYLDRIEAALGGREVEVFAGARRHVPEDRLREARARLDAFGADTIVALGGGSAIGFAKALRLERDVRFVAVPTTYAGSEMTTLWGITAGGRKTTGRDPRVRPDAVVYDLDLTLDMPKVLTVTSLMNALAHPIAALAAAGPGSPPTEAKGEGADETTARSNALEAVAAVFGALEALVRAPGDRRARAQAQRAAGRAAAALDAGATGLHHKLAHRLGGAFDLDHAGLHGVLLPHSLRRLRAEGAAAVAEIAARLGISDVEGNLFDFLIRAGAPVSLRALGVSLGDLEAWLATEVDLPRDLLRAAFHGRRPSSTVRLEDWGLREPVAVRGPAPEAARRVIVAIHGRGATAESVLGRAVELVGNDPEVCVVAPQATDNVWYAARYDQPRAELGAPFVAALAEVGSLLQAVVARAAPERVALFGFSQGACLAIEAFVEHSREPGQRLERGRQLAALVALAGAGIGRPDEQPAPGPGAAGVPVLLGASREDAWVVAAHVEGAAARLAAAGAAVTTVMAPGNGHALHAAQRLRARSLLRAVAPPAARGGLGGFHESESLPGALPREQNSPLVVPYGLYAEQVNATGFVAPRAQNRRSWLYRIRPSAEQGPNEPRAHATLAGDFTGEPAELNLSAWSPTPLPGAPADFVDGLITVGGAGSPRLRRGYAVHVYAANRGMEDRCFANTDGDLLVLPERGALTVLTELGVLRVAPGELALLPRGIRFSVFLDDGVARGYVAESFGRSFGLPERGPIGANGLADARHFRVPAAWHEDRLARGYRVTTKVGGGLAEATQDHSPFDVVAWHGNHAPSVYDLGAFSPVGSARIDHIDPSVHTVLSATLDEEGAHTLDLVVFVPRWDPTERTFRPPYFHRNVTTEINGIIREPAGPAAAGGGHAPPPMFLPGCVFVTPSLVPHGVVAASVEREVARGRAPAAADRPGRSAETSLWFQLETALPFCPAPAARHAANRLLDWPSAWGAYRKHFVDPT